jgi:hypothetical protein
MRVAYRNYLDDATLTASSYLIGYEANNVKDSRLSIKWYSDSTTTQTVICDLGSAYAIDTLAIISHNIASAASVVIQGNAADSWTAPSVIETMTWNSNMILKFITTATYRYWRFVFSGLTDGLEIGKLWVGSYLQIDPSSSLDFKVDLIRDDIVVHGLGRQKYSSEGNGWRKISLTFPKADSSMVTSLMTMYNAIGNYGNLIFCNFDSLRTYPIVEPMYCAINGAMGFQHTNNMNFSYKLELEEEL